MSGAVPRSLQDLIDAISQLPGVGPRSAERYAYYLLKSDQHKSHNLATALTSVHKNIKKCPVTFALIEKSEETSPLYSDPRRNKQLVAVVADHSDIVAIEKSNSFNGTYHVLGGLISPIEGVGPDQLKIAELLKRIDADDVKELILATNASVEGESTALLITQQIGKRPVKITRLARGLPVGLDLEYADQITLNRAFEGRQTV